LPSVRQGINIFILLAAASPMPNLKETLGQEFIKCPGSPWLRDTVLFGQLCIGHGKPVTIEAAVLVVDVSLTQDEDEQLGGNPFQAQKGSTFK
jgi:hypothetical protein